MAIGWLAILKSVPWVDVISSAPKVADGAKKLWSAVAKKSATQKLPESEAKPDLTPEARTIAELEMRVSAMEAAVTDLHSQMLTSSELIKALAEQNTQLIKRIESNRIRFLWLVSTTALVSIAVVASWLWH